MSVDGKDFGKKVGRVDEAREKNKTEELLAGMSIDFDKPKRGCRSTSTSSDKPKKSQDRSHTHCRQTGEGVTVGGGQSWLG
jgi:hypothetical protein